MHIVELGVILYFQHLAKKLSIEIICKTIEMKWFALKSLELFSSVTVDMFRYEGTGSLYEAEFAQDKSHRIRGGLTVRSEISLVKSVHLHIVWNDSFTKASNLCI